MNRRSFMSNSLAAMLAAGIAPQSSFSALAEISKVPGATSSRWPIDGRLRVLKSNPRYFTDNSGRAIYLTGSHTWANFQDISLPSTPRFDYPAYIQMMVRHNMNFMRFWHWEQAAWAPWTRDKILFEPLPYLRTGPGLALDGLPKFDLEKFNPEYFQRMRSRIAYASDHGIYASIQLFQSFSANKKPLDYYCGHPWIAHPYNPANNINNFSGEEDHSGTISLHRPAVRTMQAAYIGKVIDTVNDLDNVLYEVMNEGGDRDWDWWVVDLVHSTEAKKGRVHPVGLTGYDSEPLTSMLQSPCDWVSPSVTDYQFYKTDPPAWDGKKVAVLDTDHIWGTGGTPLWAWKSFCRGYNTLLMDPWISNQGQPCSPSSTPGDPTRDVNRPDAWIWEPIRKALGNTRTYATRMNLAAMTPRDALASSGFCLANPGEEYLIFLPEGYEVKVDLSAGKQNFAVEWMHPIEGNTVDGGTMKGGHKFDFEVPFAGPATLYIHRV